MKETLSYLFDKNILTQQEARDILTKIGQGQFSDPEIASFLTVYMMRPITPEELGGFREALLDLCVAVNLDDFKTIDVCGTGGDEKNTFNISTLSAFVLAGAGINVVKHGNYAVSSACGSSNILEFFGYKFSNDPDKIKKEMDTAHICYLHAPLFHPAMKYVGPVRKSLKMKTFFNLLGPMVNPTRPQHQIVGVYSDNGVNLYHKVFANAGIKHNILFSLDGYDEISLTGDFRVVSDQTDKIYKPADLGFSKVKEEEIFGGNSVEEAATIFSSILDGEGTVAQNHVVIANTAFAIKCFQPETPLTDAVEIARETIISGKAKAALKKLISLQ
ncbi:MAG: anthranilate phosphoribosyltransferase [Bacteroidales bacterium]|nr:anthranilate phosphoribosyltransferase [Bacteroidales bacterium]